MEQLVRDNAEDVADAYERIRTQRLEQELDVLRKERAFAPDPVLPLLLQESPIEDTRHALIFNARPTGDLRNNVTKLQAELRSVFAHYGLDDALWLTEPRNLHITLMDVQTRAPPAEIEQLVLRMRPHVEAIVGRVKGPFTLTRPKLMLDKNAIALTWVPADTLDDDPNMPTLAQAPHNGVQSRYNHLQCRYDLYQGCASAGFTPHMRYVSLSAHCTLARFLQPCHGFPQQLLDSIMSCLVDQDRLSWTIRPQDIHITHGANWYGGGRHIWPR